MGNFIDKTGQRFGSLTAIKYIGNKDRSYWLCRCDCGYEYEVITSNLIKRKSNYCPRKNR